MAAASQSVSRRRQTIRQSLKLARSFLTRFEGAEAALTAKRSWNTFSEKQEEAEAVVVVVWTGDHSRSVLEKSGERGERKRPPTPTNRHLVERGEQPTNDLHEDKVLHVSSTWQNFSLVSCDV